MKKSIFVFNFIRTGNRGRRSHDKTDRGVALIATLLLLMLLVAMTLAMTIAVTSDTLINRYYRDFRSSFYAADSGVNIVRQYMMNQLQTNAQLAGATFATTGTPPLSSADASSTLTNVLTAYASTSSILGGQGASSWASKFNIVSSQSGTLGTTLTGPLNPCAVSYTGTATNTSATIPFSCTYLPTCTPAASAACSTFAITDFNYTFPYTITAVGQSLASEQQIVEDAGNLTLDVHVQAGGSSAQSFAGWGMFIDQYPECTGNDLVAGTITGPVFTNGAWTFGTSGSYTFTGKVGSVAGTFGYDLSNGCQELAAASARSGSSSITPSFQAGYTLGANKVPLPTNTFSQKEAVVDGKGTLWGSSETTAQQNAAMNAALKNVTTSGTPAYPSGGTTNPGVYLGYTSTTTGGVTTNTMSGGGIYVEGNADSVQMSTATAVVSGVSQSQQIFTITQGNTITTITENLNSPQSTTVSSATTTTTGSGRNQHTTTTTTTTSIVGVPENSATATASAATMLYVDGNIGTSTSTGLSGPGQGVAAIQNGSAVTVTANGNINVTGDILYKEEPVTTTQNQIPNTPVDTLISANNYGQVLGLFTATGNVNLYNQQSNSNLEIDASIATISNGGSGGIVNNGNSIGTLTIVGGRIQNTIQSINSNTRNVLFDQRFSQGGFAPPWFPSTTVTVTGSDSVVKVSPGYTRTQWLAVY